MVRFLEGPAASGKTTQAIHQMETWLRDGVPPQNILVLVPQRTLGRPYQKALAHLEIPNAFDVQVVTFNGLAQRSLTLFWSLIADKVIPNWQGQEPTYLTIETSQYFMAQFVEPVLHQGYFDSINLNRPRLIAQILNNLSAAAVNGFSLEEVLSRLTTSWGGHSSRLLVYQAAINVARAFREHCLRHVLLDFSLQIDLYARALASEAAYERYARDTYRYLIVDNAEENFPVTLDFVTWIWNTLDDGLIVYDRDAGFRVFLGAVPDLAYALKDGCKQSQHVEIAYDRVQVVQNLEDTLERHFKQEPFIEYNESPRNAFEIAFHTFYPQMLDWTAERVVYLIQSGVSPREIVVLAPFLGDSLRFTLINYFQNAGIPFVSHRPSRAIRDEPVARAVLTCMKLAYSQWVDTPSRADVTQMFIQFIEGLDPIRAELLAQIVYRGHAELGSFDRIRAPMQNRITYRVGERYEHFRLWLKAFQGEAEGVSPDHFLHRLFDLISQLGYGFHLNLDAGRVVSQLIDSAYHFRDVVAGDRVEWGELAKQYIQLVGDGMLAAVHTSTWHEEEQDAVFLVPAYTFLMRNRFVDYQFWVDVGSNAWYERIEQPVTHPYVLRRDYPQGQVWTDELDYRVQNELFGRLLLGLTRRCRRKIFLAIADLGEQGFEQRGALLRVFNRILGTYGSSVS